MPEACSTDTEAEAPAPTKREETAKAFKGMRRDSPAQPLLYDKTPQPNWAPLARAHHHHSNERHPAPPSATPTHGHSSKSGDVVPDNAHQIKDDYADNGIPLLNVTSKILSKVIKYCKKHVEAPKAAAASEDRFASSDDDLKAWDAEFVKVDQATLFNLILVCLLPYKLKSPN
ncbi:hypothetical protein FH972_011096 [Carpinus fangiana]|uniref:SKP1 component POZ domain-containing protein n=1 Tax=Carpinus fangiana TaxID=176857 RepID=A0A660KQA6_9ROSI|nr:hypothetical protein FH972_011096 [Carpinus fangiana]